MGWGRQPQWSHGGLRHSEVPDNTSRALWQRYACTSGRMEPVKVLPCQTPLPPATPPRGAATEQSWVGEGSWSPTPCRVGGHKALHPHLLDRDPWAPGRHVPPFRRAAEEPGSELWDLSPGQQCTAQRKLLRKGGSGLEALGKLNLK